MKNDKKDFICRAVNFSYFYNFCFSSGVCSGIMKNKKRNPFKANRHEIIYNLINCLIASGLVFLGSLSSGNISMSSFFFSFIAFLITFFTKFKNYWSTQKSEYSVRLFNFVS